MFSLKKSVKNLQDWEKLHTFAPEQDKNRRYEVSE